MSPARTRLGKDLAEVDHDRIDDAVAFIRTHDTTSVLAALLPDLPGEDRATIARHARFGHVALLVFPAEQADVPSALSGAGLAVGETTPSVVVRQRLLDRYPPLAGSCEVGITRASVVGDDGGLREIEVFALPVTDDNANIAEDERVASRESHIALQVDGADEVILAGLRSLLAGPGGLVPDGGGHNPFEDSTVLYFRVGDRVQGPHRRLELISHGRFPSVLAAHLEESDARQGNPAAERLLWLMSGAWTTQAIAVAAELGVPDRLAAEEPAGPARLAALTGTDPTAMARLLRFLAGVGIVRRDRAGYRLTEPGHLLRADAPGSMRALALIYGGPFYRSFGNLAHSVRTGEDAFANLFGKGHFDYFAERPELGELFDRSMAASSSMFDPIADLADFHRAGVVVDIAGGNGALLGRILDAWPHLRGVLFERPSVVPAARTALAAYADRIEIVAGHFEDGLPEGGDVYVLSRVLHDWDDEQCRTLLKRCSSVLPEDAELLVVERLLPEDDSPSLAVAWDLHMMCNVGGRERTLAEYRDLLAEAGLELVEHHALPLGAALLRARGVTT